MNNNVMKNISNFINWLQIMIMKETFYFQICRKRILFLWLYDILRQDRWLKRLIKNVIVGGIDVVNKKMIIRNFLLKESKSKKHQNLTKSNGKTSASANNSKFVEKYSSSAWLSYLSQSPYSSPSSLEVSRTTTSLFSFQF